MKCHGREGHECGKPLVHAICSGCGGKTHGMCGECCGKEMKEYHIEQAYLARTAKQHNDWRDTLLRIAAKNKMAA